MDFVNRTLAWIPLSRGLSSMGAFFTIVALVVGIYYLTWNLFPPAPVKPEVSGQLDGHPGLLDQEEPMSNDMESSLPTDVITPRETFSTDVTTPRETFSKVWKTTESGFLSGATLQYSPGGHGLVFPTWVTPPLSFVVRVGSPDYDIEDVEVTEDSVDNGDTRSIVVKDGNEIRWPLLEANLPNLQAFLKGMHKDANSVIYKIDRLRFDCAKELLLSMKANLWASFKGTPLALWIEVHLAHVLLRVAFTELSKANTMLEQALTTFNQCLDDMTYKGEGEYLKRLFCSSYLGRAWYFLLKGQLEKAKHDIHRVEEYEWKEDQNKLSAIININWAKTAIHLLAGDLSNAKESMHKVGFRVECTRGALNESQRAPLDIHIQRNEGNLYTALYLSAKCLLSEEEPVRFDPITDQASKQVQQICMGVIGDLWFTLGACHEAHKYYTMAAGALEIKGKSGDLILRAAGLVGRANVHMRLRKDKMVQHLEHAEEDYKESLLIYEGLGHVEGQIIVKYNLGILYMAQGTQADQVKVQQGLFDQALNHYKQAKELALRVKVRSTILADLDCKMGQIHLEKNDLTEAINLLEKGKKSRQINQEIEPLVQAWVEHQLGHCYLKRWEKEKKSITLRTAETHFINAIKLFALVKLETNTTEAHFERLWFTMFEEQKETYALLQWCLACQNRAIDAVVWGERSRSRALMQDKWKGVMQVKGDHDEWMQNLHPKKFDEVSCESAWKSLQGWTPLWELNGGMAIVQYTICRGFGLLIYVLDGSCKPSIYHTSFTELGDKLGIRNVEHIEHLVAKTVEVLNLAGSKKTKSDGEEDEEILLIKLSDLLWPIEEELNKKQGLKNLVIIPHEHLHRVPFPALYCKEQTTMLGFKKKPRQHLVEKYALSCVDSIRSLIRCSLLYESLCKKERHSNWPVTKSAALIVGIKDLHLDLGFSILENAEVEAKGVAQILQRKLAEDAIQPVLGLQATKDLVMERLPKAQIVHFATHALITPRYEEGGIFFSKPLELSGKSVGESFQASLTITPLEEPVRSSSLDQWRGREVHERTILQKELAEAVFLNADEISELKLSAHLVVLSACQTGRGVIGGEGVAGLGRALTRAGVPCTVLALWDVHDGAAKELMITFYTNLVCEGMSVATALQKAMVQMIHKKSVANESVNLWRVKHWAAFQAFGLQSVSLQSHSSL